MTYDLTWQPYRDNIETGLTVIRRRTIRSPHDPDQSVLFYEAWLPELPMPAATAWFLNQTQCLSLLYVHVNDNLRRCKLATMLCVAASSSKLPIVTGSVNELSRAWCQATGWRVVTPTGWRIEVDTLVDVAKQLPPYALVAAIV